ncbi:exostosin family protein [Mucilaginibacter sp. BT774]|uniref:exostosin domain-containing protein n=1 Tax=Mucilaginibacter sp. BT774 TaxID=3062276 RepID=UPI0026767C81|nr:exostosin family protein [Mucilaginibacter sp. BT774]MDO3627501.1 exostosin family protein [Mucilaginibacter sp. BT774]
MKIYILEPPAVLQPKKQNFRYPAHNKDYGIEQDFLIWIKRQKHLLTMNPEEADWHYLPIYWTRWHINHNFAANGEGLEELQDRTGDLISDDAKTFTVSQFDGGTLVNIGKATVFTAARTINEGIDVPILCSRHRKPLFPIKKKYLATFNGSFDTHPVRVEMKKKYTNTDEILVQGGLPTRFWKRWFWAKNYNLNTLRSYIALCPRGTSCNSFRFFEAMQLGVAPCLIGDLDVRPFKNYIPWDDMSYYVSSVESLDELLHTFDKEEALEKGKKAFQYWKNELYYQKWCRYALMELNDK